MYLSWVGLIDNWLLTGRRPVGVRLNIHDWMKDGRPDYQTIQDTMHLADYRIHYATLFIGSAYSYSMLCS